MDHQLDEAESVDEDLAEEREPLYYNVVSSIGYAKVNANENIFKCIILDCPFRTTDSLTFTDHLNSDHLGTTWNGFCHFCRGFVRPGAPVPILNEWNHMKEFHIDVDPPVWPHGDVKQ